MHTQATDETAITISLKHGIGDIPAAVWDACANPGGEIADNPFTTHAFLSSLEESGSATADEGWAPHHVVAETQAGEVIGAMPMYLKTHSYGEYVFDWGWADAFERAGGRYYPKLQVSVPFTPATGRRLLVRNGHEPVAEALVLGAMQVASQSGISSIHWTFLPKREQDMIVDLGGLARQDQQFHWLNHGYATFDDFLAALQSRKRKQLRKERERAHESGVDLQVITGSDLREEHWDAFYRFYMDTGSRKWGTPYLTRTFFSLIGERMAEDIVLVMGRRAGRWVAGALNFKGSDTLFGRNWGSIEHHDCLHFEACYYQAIEYAIAHGLSRVEAGAQGAHKMARGYEPALTYSAHWVANPSFRAALEDYLRRERDAVDYEREHLSEHTPFRRTCG